MAKIKRSELKHFLNITPESPHVLGSASATYALLGDGVTDSEVDYNGENTEETYIADDNATITVDSFAPTFPVKMTAMRGDDAFIFIDQLRLDRAVLGDAETDMVEVRIYESGGPTAYPAEQQKVAIAIDDLGDEGGAPVKLNFVVAYIGEPVPGTFNASSKVFTATP